MDVAQGYEMEKQHNSSGETTERFSLIYYQKIEKTPESFQV